MNIKDLQMHMNFFLNWRKNLFICLYFILFFTSFSLQKQQICAEFWVQNKNNNIIFSTTSVVIVSKKKLPFFFTNFITIFFLGKKNLFKLQIS